MCRTFSIDGSTHQTLSRTAGGNNKPRDPDRLPVRPRCLSWLVSATYWCCRCSQNRPEGRPRPKTPTRGVPNAAARRTRGRAMTTQLLKVIMPSFVYMRWSTIGVTWFTMSSTSAPSRGHAGHGKRRRGICQSSAGENFPQLTSQRPQPDRRAGSQPVCAGLVNCAQAR